MPKLSKILRDNAPLLESIYGNIDDLIVTNNYRKALKPIVEMDKVNKNDAKYKRILGKMGTDQLTDEDYYNSKEEINYDDPAIKESEAYKKFAEYESGIKADVESSGEGASPKIMNFQDYLKNNPELQTEIDTNYKSVTQTPKTKEELQQLLFEKAELSQEDIDFYKGYKAPDREEYNKSLSDYITKNVPGLVSRGSLGGSLAEQFAQRLSGRQLTDPEVQKKKTQFHGDYKFVFDESGNELSRELIKEEKPKDFKLSSSSTIKQYTDKDGNTLYGYFEPNPGSADAGYKGWKYTGVDVSEDDYNYQEGLGEYANTKKSGSSGRSRGRGTRGGPKSSPESSQYDQDAVGKLKQFAKLKAESVALGWDNFSKEVDKDGFSVESKRKQEYEQLQAELDQMFPFEDIDGLANDVYKGDFKNKGKKQNEVEYLQERRDSNPKLNVAQFMKEVTKAWGRSDLTADQWADEIFQEDWSDEEWKLIQTEFNKMFGLDINTFSK